MALDLIESKRLAGATVPQVRELLGTPDGQEAEWVYALGQCSGFGWEHSELAVRFDSARRASEVRFQRSR